MGNLFDTLRREAPAIACGFLLLMSYAYAVAADENDSAKPEQHFDVMEYRVIGNTALAVRDIERVLYPLLGMNKSLKDVEAARTALETYYHDHGYGTVFVDIPPQTVTDGLVRLRVTEGRIEREQIGGAHYFPERDVIAALPAAKPGTVLAVVQTSGRARGGQCADSGSFGGAGAEGGLRPGHRGPCPASQ
jgi:hypothetical protein